MEKVLNIDSQFPRPEVNDGKENFKILWNEPIKKVGGSLYKLREAKLWFKIEKRENQKLCPIPNLLSFPISYQLHIEYKE